MRAHSFRLQPVEDGATTIPAFAIVKHLRHTKQLDVVHVERKHDADRQHSQTTLTIKRVVCLLA